MTRAAGLAERFNIFVKNHTYRTSPMRADWEEIIDILGGLITPEYWAKFNFKEFDRLTDENSRFKSSLEEIALGDGTYGAQAHEYKQIARKALKPPEKEGWKE